MIKDGTSDRGRFVVLSTPPPTLRVGKKTRAAARAWLSFLSDEKWCLAPPGKGDQSSSSDARWR